MKTLRSLLLAATVASIATPATAQTSAIPSCAAADSVVGPAPRRGPSLIRRYERITDSTQIEVRNDVVRLISTSPDASYRLITAYEGESAPTTAPGTMLHVVVAVDKNTNMTDQQVSEQQARMAEAQQASVLIDRTNRVRLPRVGHTAAVQQGNLLRDARLLETAVFAITPEVLRQFATATDRIEIQVGPVRGGFSQGHLAGIKELYRMQTCGTPASTAAVR